MSTEPIVRRPLKSGEFYCHACEQFIPLAKHEQHMKDHRKRADKGK